MDSPSQQSTDPLMNDDNTATNTNSNETNVSLAASVGYTLKEEISLDEKKRKDSRASLDGAAAGSDLPSIDNKAKEAKEDAEKKKKEEKPPSVSFLSLFRLADGLDIFLMILGTLAAMANGASMPSFSLIFGKFIDIFDPTNLNKPGFDIQAEITTIALWFLWIGIAVFGLSYLEVAMWMIAGERQIRRVREAYLKAILSQEIGWFDITKTSELSTRITSDTDMMGEAIGEKVGNMFHHLSTFIAGFVMGFVNGWQLTLVILAVSPLLALSGGFMAKTLGELTKKGQDAYAKAGAVAEECLQSIRTIVMFSGERKESKRYDSNLGDALDVGVRKGLVNGLGMGLVMLFMFATYALAFWYGGSLISAGTRNVNTNKPWTGGDVVTVFFSVIMGAFSIGQASPAISSVANGRAGAYKIFQVLDRKSSIDPFSNAGTKLDSAVRGDVEFRNVRFAYPSRPEVTIFDRLNLTVKAGQKVALVGDSGGGKSTVVGLLERFYDPLDGQVMLDGVDIKSLNIKFLRTQMGLVSQEPNLFGTTIKDNIAYGKEGATMDEIRDAAILANVHTFISSLPEGYNTLVGEKGVQISGGQKQRIAIARAMIRNPKILILDEATSALDTENERIVQEAIDKVMHGRTCIMIAHRLATIRNCDIIAFVKDGHIVEQGTHDELMALDQNYKHLVEREHSRQKEEHHSEGAVELDKVREEKLFNMAIDYPSPSPTKKSSEIKKSSDKVKKSKDNISVSLSPSAEAKSPDGGGGKSKKDDVEAGVDQDDYQEEDIYPVPFRRLLNLMAGKAFLLPIGILASGINGAVMPVFSIVFARILKAFQNTDHNELQKNVNFLSLMFVVIAIGALVGNAGSIFTFNYIGEHLTFRLRQVTFRSIMHQEIGFFDQERNAVGALTTRLAKEASLVHSLYSQRIGLVFQSVVTLIVGLVIAFVAGWKLTLVVLGCVPFIAAAGSAQMKFVQGFSAQSKGAYELAGKVATESITNIRTVAAFSAESREVKRYSSHLEGPLILAIRRSQVAGIGFGLSQFVLFAAYTLAFWFGGYLLKHNEWKPDPTDIDTACNPFTVPTFWISQQVCVQSIIYIYGFQQMMNVFMAVVLSAMGIGQAMGFAPDAAKAKVAVSTIFRTIDRRSAIDIDTKGDKPNKEVQGSIEFREVHFEYPTRRSAPVFRGLNMKVPAGKTVALVGGSGAGKSTIIALLERFYDPSQGQIFLDGTHELKSLDLEWLRSQVGLVSQEPVLFGTTIHGNITYGCPQATQDEVEAAARLANAHDFIAAMPMGYNTHVGDKHVQLSGGQKQRVAIARAILRNPRILLLDEATSALDSESQRVVQEALENLMKNRTSIIIAHRLSTVQNADLIIVLKEGKVVEQGTHSELLALNQEYAALVQRQL